MMKYTGKPMGLGEGIVNGDYRVPEGGQVPIDEAFKHAIMRYPTPVSLGDIDAPLPKWDSSTPIPLGRGGFGNFRPAPLRIPRSGNRGRPILFKGNEVKNLLGSKNGRVSNDKKVEKSLSNYQAQQNAMKEMFLLQEMHRKKNAPTESTSKTLM